MAEEFDESQLEFAAPQAMKAAQPVAPVAQPARPMEEFSDGDLEFLPSYANGLSADAPINESPLDITERFKLGIGEEKGNLEFLKKRFEAVQQDGSGNLVVKDKGAWYRVDPDNFDSADPWKVTKELLGEVAENAFEIGTVGASVAAGIATGGASLAIQAGAAGLAAGSMATARTSMGRLVGTYKATPEQQLKDVAFETMLNTGGVFLAAGIKPGAKMIGKGLEKAGLNLSKLDAAPREAYKKLFGTLTGAGSDNMETLLQMPQKVSAKIGTSADDLVRESVNHLEVVANSADELAKEVYQGKMSNLLKAINPQFSENADDLLLPVYKKMVLDGAIDVQVAGKALKPAEAVVKLNALSGSFGDDVAFKFKPREEMLKVLQARGQTDALDLTDDAAHSLYKHFFERLEELRGVKSFKGASGAKQLLDLNRHINDLTWKLQLNAKSNGINAISRKMADAHTQIKASLNNIFDKGSKPGLFSDLQSSYDLIKSEVGEISKTMARADKSGSIAPYEQLLKRLSARGGQNVAQKDSFNSALQLASEYAPNKVGPILEAREAIRVNSAAASFNEWIRPGLIGQGVTVGTAGSIMTGSAFSGYGLAAGVATSPRLVKHLTTALFESKGFLNKLGAKGVAEMSRHPQMMNAFIASINQYVKTPDATAQRLLNGGGAQ